MQAARTTFRDWHKGKEKRKNMKTAKFWKTAVLAAAATLLLGACSGGEQAPTTGPDDPGTANGEPSENLETTSGLPVLGESPYKLTASEEGATDFETLNTDYQSPYQNDTCVNISPSFLGGDTGLSVFKYTLSNDTFLLYDGAVYPLGGSGGDGVTSMAMADFTGDGAYELYYAYSSGSDSHVGYFDPATKETHDDMDAFRGTAIVLAADGSNLNIYSAEVSDYESLTSMVLTSGQQIASVGSKGSAPAVIAVDAAPDSSEAVATEDAGTAA